LSQIKFPFQVYFFICYFTYTIGLEYDYIVVSFLWQPATCREPSRRCTKLPREDFSLHGLWPTKFQGWGPGPFYCPLGDSFKRSLV